MRPTEAFDPWPFIVLFMICTAFGVRLTRQFWHEFLSTRRKNPTRARLFLIPMYRGTVIVLVLSEVILSVLLGVRYSSAGESFLIMFIAIILSHALYSILRFLRCRSLAAASV